MKPITAILDYKSRVTNNDLTLINYGIHFKFKYHKSAEWQYLKIITTADYKTIQGYSIDNCTILGEYPLWINALLTASNNPENYYPSGCPKTLFLKKTTKYWWYDTENSVKEEATAAVVPEQLIRDKEENTTLRHRFHTQAKPDECEPVGLGYKKNS